tara:strand:- start:1 stop:183 length:183 start_codon:yes stop_codon:yes gene_type:complete
VRHNVLLEFRCHARVSGNIKKRKPLLHLHARDGLTMEQAGLERCTHQVGKLGWRGLAGVT